MAGGGVNQLKGQVEANQLAVENSMKEFEIKQDQMGARQDDMDLKINSTKSTVAALQTNFNSQFAWIRQMLDPTGEKQTYPTPPTNPNRRGLLETPPVPQSKPTTSINIPSGQGGSEAKKHEAIVPLLGNQFSNYKAPKYEFPKFDGNKDVVDWLQQCNCFFFINPMPMNERVLFTSLYLSCKA